jgi:hypothetical protein
MDIISAYCEVGTYRGAAEACGTTHKTVRRVIARHEAGGEAPERTPRGHNYDAVAELVAGRVKKTSGKISAKRLLPPRGRRGMWGRRGTSAGWSRRRSRRGGRSIAGAAARRCGRRVSTW